MSNTTKAESGVTTASEITERRAVPAAHASLAFHDGEHTRALVVHTDNTYTHAGAHRCARTLTRTRTTARARARSRAPKTGCTLNPGVLYSHGAMWRDATLEWRSISNSRAMLLFSDISRSPSSLPLTLILARLHSKSLVLRKACSEKDRPRTVRPKSPPVGRG